MLTAVSVTKQAIRTIAGVLRKRHLPVEKSEQQRVRNKKAVVLWEQQAPPSIFNSSDKGRLYFVWGGVAVGSTEGTKVPGPHCLFKMSLWGFDDQFQKEVLQWGIKYERYRIIH